MRVVVRDGLGSDSRFPLAAFPPAGAGATHPTGWEILDLNYAEQGDAVRVTVYAMHQEYDTRRSSAIYRSKKLGVHTARMRESVRISEMEQLGYLPFTIRVGPVLERR
jgi:hypothetical protein